MLALFLNTSTIKQKIQLISSYIFRSASANDLDERPFPHLSGNQVRSGLFHNQQFLKTMAIIFTFFNGRIEEDTILDGSIENLWHFDVIFSMAIDLPHFFGYNPIENM